MSMAVQSLWEDVLSILKPQMNNESFDLWFRPIKALSMEGNRLVLQVPNAFFPEWLRDHYESQIETLLNERSGDPISLSFSVLRPADEPVPMATPLRMVLPPPTPSLPPLETHLNQ